MYLSNESRSRYPLMMPRSEPEVLTSFLPFTHVEWGAVAIIKLVGNIITTNAWPFRGMGNFETAQRIFKLFYLCSHIPDYRFSTYLYASFIFEINVIYMYIYCTSTWYKCIYHILSFITINKRPGYTICKHVPSKGLTETKRYNFPADSVDLQQIYATTLRWRTSINKTILIYRKCMGLVSYLNSHSVRLD